LVTAGREYARRHTKGEAVKKAVFLASAMLIFGLVFAACNNPVGDNGEDPPNLHRLEGAVGIDGTDSHGNAQVWRTLTADTSEFDLDESGFSFLWIRIENGTTYRIGRDRYYLVHPNDIGNQIAVIVAHRDYTNAIRSRHIDVNPYISYEGYFPIFRGDFTGRRIYFSLSDFFEHEGMMPRGVRLVEPRQYGGVEWFRNAVRITDAALISGDYDEILSLDAFFYHGTLRDITVVVRVGGVPSSVLIRLL